MHNPFILNNFVNSTLFRINMHKQDLMIKPVKFLLFVLINISSVYFIDAQRLKFTTDTSYLRELNIHLQKSNKKELTEQAFLAFSNEWNSGKLSLSQKELIIKLSNNLLKKRANAYPHFYDFMQLFISILKTDKQISNITKWTQAFEFYSHQRNFNMSRIDRLFKSVNYLIDSLTFYETRAVKWAFDADADYELSFNEHEGLNIKFNKTNLYCYAKRDSFIVRDTRGMYSPVNNFWTGEGGKISWERANYPPDSVYAELSLYRAKLVKPEIYADSVQFTNMYYFKGKLLGSLDEKIIANATGGKASYPRFESYDTRVDLPNLVKGVDYTGGFLMQGAKFIGKGADREKAILYFRKDKELKARAESSSFLISKTRIFSKSADVSLMIDEDSLYVAGIDLNYIIKRQRILLTNSQRDEIGSIFLDTYHGLDVDVRQLSYSLQDSLIYFKTPPGTTYRKAVFRSYNFYSDDEYERLGLMDRVHPLEAINRMVTKGGMFIFGPIQLASYLEKDVKFTRQLMIILAKKGFIHYDYNAQVAYAEQKLFDYVQARFKNKDYDEIAIISEPKRGNNATLNLKDYTLNIRGVKPFALSNNRRVGVFPKNGELRVHEDMDFDFDGRLKAGLAGIYGEGMTFNYEDFLIDFKQIDSLKLVYRSEEKNKDSVYEYAPVLSVIENVTGTLHIDQPENKAGNETFPEFPKFESKDTSYVFYDHNNKQDSVYKRDEVQFVNYPFEIDSLNTIMRKNVKIAGMFKSGGIFPDFEEYLTVQADSSLGFVHELDSSGTVLHNGLAVYENTITLDNQGIRGSGKVHYLSAHVYSEDITFFPDSMNCYTNMVSIDLLDSDTTKTQYPDMQGDSTYVHWEPERDQMFINTIDDSLRMYKNEAAFAGQLKITPAKLEGKGGMSFKNASLQSDTYTFFAEKFTADTSNFELKPIELSESPFLTHNVNSNVDFKNNIGLFKSNGDSSYIDFPVNQYKCYMNYFTWFMGVDLIDIGSLERLKNDSLIADVGVFDSLTSQFQTGLKEDYQASLSDTTYTEEELLASSRFVSTNPGQDSLSFIARSSSYDIQSNIIRAKGVKLIKVADAHIYPAGSVVIKENAKLETLEDARIVANTYSRYHDFYGATVDIFGAKKYIASADYEYYDRMDSMQIIHFDEIKVGEDLHSYALGEISEEANFQLSPEFAYFGKVRIDADNKYLNFDGYTKINHECSHRISSLWMGFRADINPDSIVIPLPEVPKDKDLRKLYAGLNNTRDSVGVYPTFMTTRRRFADKQIFSAGGVLYFNQKTGYFEITDSAKLAKPEIKGNYFSMHKKLCIALGEGNIDFALNLGQVKLNSAGKFRYNMESMSLGMDLMLGVDFFFQKDALNYMADKLNQAYELEPVDASKPKYQTALKELVGLDRATKFMNDIALMGGLTYSPPEMGKAIFFTDVEMVWNKNSHSYLSKGPIGIGTINNNPINKMVDGIIELAPKRSGDVINIYIPLDEKDWFFFTYTRGTMKSISSFNDFNNFIVDLKDKERKPPVKDEENPYMFFPASERIKENFLTQIKKAESKKEKGNFNENNNTQVKNEFEEEETEVESVEEENEENVEEQEIMLEEVEENGKESIEKNEATKVNENELEESENENINQPEEELLEEEGGEIGNEEELLEENTKVEKEKPKEEEKSKNNKTKTETKKEDPKKNKDINKEDTKKKEKLKEKEEKGEELSEEEEQLEEELLEEEEEGGGGGGVN